MSLHTFTKMDEGQLNSMAYKRLRKELEQNISSNDPFIQLACVGENDLSVWVATIRGPPSSCYDGYVFDLEISVPPDYPISPPSMRFLTKIFHPNVYFNTGEICIDILKKDWTPAWSLQSACRAIMSILSDPNADSPLNCDAGNMLRSGDALSFESMCVLYCREFATALPPHLALKSEHEE
jgi:peroxin-4